MRRKSHLRLLTQMGLFLVKNNYCARTQRMYMVLFTSETAGVCIDATLAAAVAEFPVILKYWCCDELQ